MVRIFTETLPDIKFRNFDHSTFPDLVEPVICLIQTDSYSAAEISSFEKLLSVQEQEKAARFRFVRDHDSYIITHGMLRKILGSYLDCEPAKIEFSFNNFGKPSLANQSEKLYFNLSHRSGLSVLAFSSKSQIGIDVEKIDPGFDFDLIAKTHFSNAENSFIDAEKSDSLKRFYTLWTRKEALLKAVGTGIGENLGVEVFRKMNHFHPETPFSEIGSSDYYLTSFEYPDNYMITAARSHSGGFEVIVLK